MEIIQIHPEVQLFDQVVDAIDLQTQVIPVVDCFLQGNNSPQDSKVDRVLLDQLEGGIQELLGKFPISK